jgi:hypothetical protein
VYCADAVPVWLMTAPAQITAAKIALIAS